MKRLTFRSLAVSLAVLLLFAAVVPAHAAAATSFFVINPESVAGYAIFRIGAKEVLVKGPNVAAFKPEILKNEWATVEMGRIAVMDAAPFIENDRTYVPVRYLANALGVTDENVGWDPGTYVITLSEPGLPKVEMRIGENRMTVNGEEIPIDVAPVIRDRRAMLPAKYVAEALGYTAEWDAATKTVLVYKDTRPPAEELKKAYLEFDVPLPSQTDRERFIQAVASGKPIPKDIRPKIEKYAAKLGMTLDEYIEYEKSFIKHQQIPAPVFEKGAMRIMIESDFVRWLEANRR